MAGFFIWTALHAFLLPLPAAVQWRILALNAVILSIYSAIIRFNVPYLRDWLPVALMLVGYEEMGWFARPKSTIALEEQWVYWDRLLLNDWGGRAAVEFLGPVIPTILEIAYPLVYTMGVFGLIVLYVYRKRDRVDDFLFPMLLATFAAYALFPFFPSEPPRTVFPNQDLPNYRSLLRAFNHWYLNNLGIHTSVFPSAHASSSLGAALALRGIFASGGPRWIWMSQLVLAILIAVSIVYGRYHYAVDALGGWAVAIAAYLVATIRR